MVILDSTNATTTVVLEPDTDIPASVTSVEISFTAAIGGEVTIIPGTIVGDTRSRYIRFTVDSDDIPDGVVQGVGEISVLSGLFPTWGNIGSTWGAATQTYGAQTSSAGRTLIETEDIRIIR